ncbi:pca operon transcription factor PcaQ [uncultured Shimia sp.]|uniref:pca operon transcription factor PcaQ n=1 Tax=uncultured Shimia sp. TaxID=573152 RepID=UPI0025DB3E7E|nr:pca operon transcription factor PcaQ [uncultured Shimia sp.]
MIDRRIKFRHIQCFAEIVRHNSLKTAALHLHLTQPAISKTLKELEEIVGSDLLVRNRGGVSLTKPGEVFLHFAQMSLAALQQGLNGVAQLETAGKVSFSVGALPSVAARLMPEVVQAFAKLAPDVTLHIHDGPHRYLIDELRQGRLDVVIGRMGAPEVMKGIAFTQLYDEHVEFVVRKGHPLLAHPDIHRLSDWPVIFPPKASAIRPLVERALVAQGVGEIGTVVESVSGAFGRNYALSHDAIWIISNGVVAKELESGALVSLQFDTSLTKGPVGLMALTEGQVSAAESLFRHTLVDVAERLT